MSAIKLIELDQASKEYALDSIAEGKTVLDICNHLKMSTRTFSRALVKDPLFAKEMTNARAIAAHVLVDSLKTIYDGCETLAEATIARGKSENIRWLASKLVPETYGDRMQVQVTSIDLTKVLEAASNRVIPFLEMQNTTVIDVKSNNTDDSNT